MLTVLVAASLLISAIAVDDDNDHYERITIATFAFQLIQTIVILWLLYSWSPKEVVAYLDESNIRLVLGFCLILYAFFPAMNYFANHEKKVRAAGPRSPFYFVGVRTTARPTQPPYPWTRTYS